MKEEFIKMDYLEAFKRILKSMYYLKEVSNPNYANHATMLFTAVKHLNSYNLDNFK